MQRSYQIMTKFQPGEEVLVYNEKDDAMVRGVVVRTHAFLDVCPAPGQLPEWGIEYRVAFRGYEQTVEERQLIRHERWSVEFPPLTAGGDENQAATEPLLLAGETVGQLEML